MKQRVKKAFILAAGYGTRMLPLTRAVPKPMLPLWGVPMVDRTLDLVQSWGVEDVVINVHHGADVIVRHLVDNPRDDLRVQISFEPDILGTGGALTRASWFVGGGKPFWMVNADVGARLDVRPIIRAFKLGETIASSWLMASRGPRTVECADGMITKFRSRQPGAAGTYTFCGVHLVDPTVLKYLPKSGFATIIDAYEKAMKRGWKVAGVPVENAWWSDMGTPDQYIQAHRETAPKNNRSWLSVSPTARVDRRATLKECVVMDNAVVSPRACASNMIFGPNVHAAKCSGVITMRADDALDDAEQTLVSAWAGSLDGVVSSTLSPRGSSRVFTRIYAGNRTAVMIRHNPERKENNLYAMHAKFLASMKIPVPLVFAEDPAHHLALYQDVGEASVQDKAAGWKSAKLEKLYRDILNELIVFHEKGSKEAAKKKLPLMVPFTSKLFAWEHALFTELLLKDRMGMGNKITRAVTEELGRVSRRLLKQPRVLVHRDLQSSNIMLKGSTWSLIDFQGMRFGPAVYDLASLLCDPYIEINCGARERLLDHYIQASSVKITHDDFWYAVIQRLSQALGAYARLGKKPGMMHFTRYIRPALLNVQIALGNVAGLSAMEDVVNECLIREKKSINDRANKT